MEASDSLANDPRCALIPHVTTPLFVSVRQKVVAGSIVAVRAHIHNVRAENDVKDRPGPALPSCVRFLNV
jgi:hypothetical protein